MIAESTAIVSRPLSIGEIFDRAVTLLVRRRRAVLVLALLTALASALGDLFLQIAAERGMLPLGLLVRFAGGLMTIYGAAAVVLLVAGADERPNPLALLHAAFARFWPILRAVLLICLAIFVTTVVAFSAVSAVSAVAAVAGRLGLVAAAVAGVVLFLGVALPAFAFELGFVVVVLEEVGAVEGVRRAWLRTMRVDLRRTWLLALAALAAYFGPVVAFEAAGDALASLTGLNWVPAPIAFLETLTAFVFFAVLAVASTDYRVRREGFDLEAALDAPLPG